MKQKKLQTFYEFAAQADVEFGKIDIEADGILSSVVTTSHEETMTSSLPDLVIGFAKAGFIGVKTVTFASTIYY